METILNKQFNAPTLKQFDCQECGKRRLLKPKDHIISNKKESVTLPNGDKIQKLIDICNACNQRFIRKYFSKKKPNETLKIIANRTKLPEDQSIEELL